MQDDCMMAAVVTVMLDERKLRPTAEAYPSVMPRISTPGHVKFRLVSLYLHVFVTRRPYRPASAATAVIRPPQHVMSLLLPMTPITSARPDMVWPAGPRLPAGFPNSEHFFCVNLSHRICM